MTLFELKYSVKFVECEAPKVVRVNSDNSTRASTRSKAKIPLQLDLGQQVLPSMN